MNKAWDFSYVVEDRAVSSCPLAFPTLALPCFSREYEEVTQDVRKGVSVYWEWRGRGGEHIANCPWSGPLVMLVLLYKSEWHNKLSVVRKGQKKQMVLQQVDMQN